MSDVSEATGWQGTNAVAQVLLVGTVLIGVIIGLFAWTFDSLGAAITIWIALGFCLYAFGGSTAIVPWATMLATIGVIVGLFDRTQTEAVVNYAVFAVLWTLLITTVQLAGSFHREPYVDLGVVAVRYGAVGVASIVGAVLVGTVVLVVGEQADSGLLSTETIPAALMALGLTLLASAFVLRRRFRPRPPPLANPGTAADAEFDPSIGPVLGALTSGDEQR